MTTTFTPKIFVASEAVAAVGKEGEPGYVAAKPANVPKYSGTITMRGPKYLEYVELQSQMDKLDAKSFALVELLSKKAPEFFVSCDITRLDDGAKINTWELLEQESALFPAISETAARIMGEHRTPPT